MGRFSPNQTLEQKAAVKARKKARKRASRPSRIVLAAFLVVGVIAAVINYVGDQSKSNSTATMTTIADDNVTSTSTTATTATFSTTSTLPPSGNACSPQPITPASQTLSVVNGDVDEDGLVDQVGVFAENADQNATSTRWYLRVEFGDGKRVAQTMLSDVVGNGSLRLNGIVRLSSGRNLPTQAAPKIVFPSIVITTGQATAVRFVMFYRAQGCVLSPIVDEKSLPVRIVIGQGMTARYGLRCVNIGDAQLVTEVIAKGTSDTGFELTTIDRRFNGVTMTSTNTLVTRIKLPGDKFEFDAADEARCEGLVNG